MYTIYVKYNAQHVFYVARRVCRYVGRRRRGGVLQGFSRVGHTCAASIKDHENLDVVIASYRFEQFITITDDETKNLKKKKKNTCYIHNN